MDPLSSTFHLFPMLPRELRYLIWKFALPDSRVVELSLAGKHNPESGLRGMYDRERSWYWRSTSSGCLVFPLLCTTHEARDVALGSYQVLAAFDQSQAPWRRSYLDYLRDKLYFSKQSYEHFLDVRTGLFKYLRCSPVRPDKIRSLAISSKGPYWWGDTERSLQQFTDPEDREVAIQYLASVFEIFTALDEFMLVIDGRSARFEGPDELVEPNSEFKDFYCANSREQFLEWIPGIVEDLKSQQPNLKIPPVRLALLINGRDTANVQRRWDYHSSNCYFWPPQH
jgi:hypothetical protein